MKKILIALFSIVWVLSGCSEERPQETEVVEIAESKKVVHPEWSKNATIYEVNIRQYSSEGTIQGFIPHLERLKSMGVDILWLMPIQPIGELKRKGTMGSYYSVRDYKAVNPEFGSEEDLRALILKAHELEMKVILDWVANHTAWDHPWMENEGWHTTDSMGNVIAPVEDWSDVADLNYDNLEMREEMIKALEYWVQELDVDGYRCDVASMVPTDFWDEARLRLDAIKPVFMLAEAEYPEHHENAFDMSYGWELMHIMNEMSKGHKNVNHIQRYMDRERERFPEDSYRMYFTTNHDENSWNGTVFERYGKNYEAFAVMSSTIWGMPLVYSGQETGMDYALEFFEKSEISWDDIKYEGFFTSLMKLNQKNPALWNGNAGGDLNFIYSDSLSNTLAYKRTNGDDEIIVVLNLGLEDQDLTFNSGTEGNFVELFTEDQMTDLQSISISLPANGYRVYVKE